MNSLRNEHCMCFNCKARYLHSKRCANSKHQCCNEVHPPAVKNPEQEQAPQPAEYAQQPQPPKAAPEAKQETLDPRTKLRNYLIERNQNYFKQIGKMCCTQKPHIHKLDLMSSMPKLTTYSGDYLPKIGEKQGPHYNLNKWPGYASDIHQPVRSEYQTQFPQREPVPVQNLFRYKEEPEEKPMVGMSHYRHNYPKWIAAPTDSCKPVGIPSTVEGIPLSKDTIYRHDYAKKPFSPSPNFAKQPALSPLASFDIPKSTYYRDNFLKWEPSKADSMKPKTKITTCEPHDGNFTSDYKNNFDDKMSKFDRCKEKIIPGIFEILKR